LIILILLREEYKLWSSSLCSFLKYFGIMLHQNEKQNSVATERQVSLIQHLCTWWGAVRPKHVVFYNEKGRRHWKYELNIWTKLHKDDGEGEQEVKSYYHFFSICLSLWTNLHKYF
jgi:hypothetical protein